MTHLTPLGHLFYGRTKYSIWRHTITASIVIAFCLTTVTITLDLALSHQLSFYSYFGLGSIAYLIAVRWFFIKNKTALARWLIIALLGCTALVTLFLWGINTIPGMLALGLSVILPGLLFGSKHITPIAIPLILCLITIYVIHGTQLYTPDTQHLSEPASPIDVVVYSTLLLALSFTTWLSVRRSEYTLERARHAEKKLRTQKSTLKAQLIQESVKLRNNQLKEIQQLYDFAVLGQNTTATLHELSNHLSVLSMDIESLHDTNEHSQAIKNVEESLRQVTAMVRAVRQKLNNYNPGGVFQPHKTLLATLREIRPSTTSATIRHQTNPLFNRQTQIKGDPLALSHIISIILKNALEACSHLPDAKIQTSISQTKATVRITVSDNGPGIPPHLTPQLFSPVVSSKPSGLGAGLFIAHTLAKTQFNGTLRLSEGGNSSLSGASFSLELPIKR